jgi:hypothetical protein
MIRARRRRRRAPALAAAALVLAALPADGEIFVERAAELGVDFRHDNGMTGGMYIAEIMGSGVALFDADGDGDLDLFFVDGGSIEGAESAAGDSAARHRLYRNELVPAGELRFTDVSAASGLRGGGYGMGVAAGDYDGDGRVDLYVTALGANRLWRNLGVDAQGNPRFEDATARAGADDRRWSVPAAFFDYDRDGWLDLWIGNYLRFSTAAHVPCRTAAGEPDYCGPVPNDAVPDRLLRNRGDGTFEETTARAGLAETFGPALGVVAADLDEDGWQDLYVGNDGAANQLWINRRDGTFADEALLAGCAVSGEGRAQASMGTDAGDYDGDGDLDLVMDNIDGEGLMLYRNDGARGFVDVTRASGLLAPSWSSTGFGAAWLDFDNDSRLDLLVVNGAIKVLPAQARAGEPLPLRQQRQLFRNVGDGRFEEVGEAAGAAFDAAEVGRGAAFGDLDDDGDVDVVVSNNAGLARVLVNAVGSPRQWLGLRLVTGAPPRDALGARVELRRAGAPPLVRLARAVGSYASANDPRALFGLGEAAALEAVVVRWPSGRSERFPPPALGGYTTLVEGTGERAP